MKDQLIIFEENKVKVRERLKDGRIDYFDLTSWSFQDRLFGFLMEQRFFEWCASSYPTPRERENIPVWFLLACGIQTSSDRCLPEVKLHPAVGLDLNEGEVQCRVKGRRI